jgi:hypothetical protein
MNLKMLQLCTMACVLTAIFAGGMESEGIAIFKDFSYNSIKVHKTNNMFEIEKNNSGIKTAVALGCISQSARRMTEEQINHFISIGHITIRKTTDGKYVIVAHGRASLKTR